MDLPELVETQPETPTQPLTQVRTLERVPAPVPPEFTNPQPQNDIWQGFASPEDEHGAQSETNHHQQRETHAPRVFGRRQVGQAV